MAGALLLQVVCRNGLKVWPLLKVRTGARAAMATPESGAPTAAVSRGRHRCVSLSRKQVSLRRCAGSNPTLGVTFLYVEHVATPMYCPRCERFFNEYAPVQYFVPALYYNLCAHRESGPYIYCPVIDTWLDTSGNRMHIYDEETERGTLAWVKTDTGIEEVTRFAD